LETPLSKEMFSVTEFLAHFGISRGTFYSEVKKKKLKIRKINSRTFVLRKEADLWMNALEEG
jgi:hypothetical protein